MISLGLYRSPFERASAVVRDGRLVAGIRERASDHLVESDAAHIERCLGAARLTGAEVTTITCVTADSAPPALALEHVPHLANASAAAISPVAAQAILASAAAPPDAIVLVFNEADGAVAEKRAGQMQPLRPLEGMKCLGGVAREVAIALGAPGRNSWTELGRIGSMGTSTVPFRADVVHVDESFTLAVRRGDILQAIAAAEASCGHKLDDRAARQRRVLEARATLAGGFLSSVFDAVASGVEHLRRASGLRAVACGGRMMGSAQCVTELVTRLKDVALVPVPEDAGMALGAALSGHPKTECLTHVAVGLDFDEESVKRTLDNCRLVYVYEPKWSRLFDHVSSVLGDGRTVAWFSGPADFGERSFGSRSVLCDPSNRWARDNINVFLRGTAVGEPIPLSIAPTATQECVDGVRSAFMLMKAPIRRQISRKVGAALDDGVQCTIHTPTPESSPALVGLLDAHYRRLGVPGLLNVPMATAGGYLVESPTEAIRYAFSSAVDLLVIGRFLVSKDYWLLRGRIE